MAEAKRTALDRAKIQVLAETFGTVMDMSAATSIAGESISTRALSESQVRGEWIETVGNPIITGLLSGGNFAFKVDIKGKVREITSASIQFDAKVLCDRPDMSCEKTEFKSGQALYLYFHSSVDGWVAVYLFDGNNDVSCLLPYQSQSEGVFAVKGGKEYFFFSEEKAYGISSDLVDDYQMICSGEQELNRIYVICSPNRFTKALDKTSDKQLPRQLSYTDFRSWMSRLKMADRLLGVKTIDISISK